MGLTGKETVVVYESKFGMRAARVGWMLEYAGARKVFLLEGGFQAWRKAHLPTEKRFEKPDHSTFRIRPVSKLLATADEIRSARSAKILDVFSGHRAHHSSSLIENLTDREFEVFELIGGRKSLQRLHEMLGVFHPLPQFLNVLLHKDIPCPKL